MQATTLPAVTLSSPVVAFDPAKLADLVLDAAKSRGKIAREFRALAESSYGDATEQSKVAVVLGQMRHLIDARKDAVIKRLPVNDRDGFKKALINQLAYASKVAGDTAGCVFKWDQQSKTYSVKDLPVKGEGSATAKGKDANSAEQSAALVSAAEAAPVLKALDRQGHLMGICAKLIEAGYTLTEIEAAFHGVAQQIAKGESAAEVAASASIPKAPEILAATLANGMGGKSKTAQKPRAKKAA